jgi:hypothetical protein
LDAIFAENLIVQGDMNIIVLTSVYYLLNRLYVLDDPIRSAYVLHYKSRHETKENEIVKGPVEEYKFFFSCIFKFSKRKQYFISFFYWL